MKMSEEMAVRLHRIMWSDMQRELGDNPSAEARKDFKYEWIRTNFPGEEHVLNNCFLCEYVKAPWAGSQACQECPIRWPGDTCCPTTIGEEVHYALSPISKILELPDRRTGVRYIANNKAKTIDGTLYFKFRERLLSMASGLPASTAIEDHVKAIQEKAVEEYFAKTPGAKLATMDVDEAFKQYADEQKAPIFHALAEASGLSASNESVKAHISRIKEIFYQSGRLERSEEIFKALTTYSGVSEGNWNVYDHAMAIMEKASNEKDLNEIRKKLKDAIDALKLYQSTLSYESNLPSSAPIADHIKQIREYAFSDGQDSERERIMDKIGEMLNK